MSASQELEQAATNHASEAVRLDKQGSKGMAITMYQKAIETLLKIVQLYPEYGLNKVYIQRAMAYQERVKVLQGGMPLKPYVDHGTEDAASPPLDGKATYDELIMQEKPNVKWPEVIGLEQAKKAIKEAIVYPVQRPDLFPLGWPRGILLFGPPGCGKTLLSAIIAALDRVELLNYAFEIEFICRLYKLSKIDEDAAVSLIRMFTDHKLYQTMMGRETNFRYSDLSSVFKNPHPWRYFRRIFQEGDIVIPDRIRKERPILNLTSHDLLSAAEPVFSALGDRLVFIKSSGILCI